MTLQLGLTAAQKTLRKGFIGGSDAGAIVAGGEEWLKLWRIKTGRAESENLDHVLAVMMGHATEPFNRFWYEKQTGRAVDRAGEHQRHQTIPYLGCTLDGITSTSGGEWASFQAKHVGKSGDVVTLRYTAQCTHEALCCGYDWWVMSTFISNSKWELTEQEVDPFFAADYLEKCSHFWQFVVTDCEPPEVAPLPVPPPKKLRVVKLHDAFRDDWPNWGPAMVEELGAYANTLAAFRAHMASKDNIKALMPDDVGTVTRGRIKVARDKAGAVRVSLSKGETDG